MSHMDTGAWNAMAQGMGLGLGVQRQQLQQQQFGFEQQQYADALAERRRQELRQMARKEAMTGYLRTLYPQPEGQMGMTGPTGLPPAPAVSPFLNGMLQDLSPDDLGVIIEETHRTRRETSEWERKQQEKADKLRRGQEFLGKFGEYMTPESRAQVEGSMADVPQGAVGFQPPAPQPGDLERMGYTADQAQGAANLFPSAGRIMQPIEQPDAPKTLSPEDQEFLAAIDTMPLDDAEKHAVKYAVRKGNALPWSVLQKDAAASEKLQKARASLATKRVSRAEKRLTAAERDMQSARLTEKEKYDPAIVAAAQRTFGAAQAEYDEAMAELGRIMLDVPGAQQPPAPGAAQPAAGAGGGALTQDQVKGLARQIRAENPQMTPEQLRAELARRLGGG